MKPAGIFFFIALLFLCIQSNAQLPDSLYYSTVRQRVDSVGTQAGRNVADTPGRAAFAIAQNPSDSLKAANALSTPVAHTSIPPRNVTADILKGNKLLNATAQPHYFANEIRDESNGQDLLFYSLCGLLLLLGIFKTFYNHYFSTLITVFFNTSLRQTQLSEQLLQAKFPSFVLNIFFVLISGLFVWLLFINSDQSHSRAPYWILEVSMAAIGIIYILKFCFLKFLGWISGITEVTNQYIFIIFLVNKLMAMVLVPFVILMAFGKKEWNSVYITLALLCVGVLILTRYIKSYGLLRQRNFPMTAFHFLLFFAGAEVVPVLIIYKVAVDYLLI